MKAKTWKHVAKEKWQEIEKILLDAGGIKDKETKGVRELWRIRAFGTVFTLWEKGTVFTPCSGSEKVVKICNTISEILGESLEKPEKEFLIGLDETGKGEVLGHSVLAGVVFPSKILGRIQDLLGVADTRKKKSTSYWDNLFMEIDVLKGEGLDFIIEKIPPWHVDQYNLNKIMDMVYQRILGYFTRKVPTRNTRIVIDDYGIGTILSGYLKSLGETGAEIIVEHKADENYQESRLASVIAKREREKVMEAITISYSLPDIPVGSGNAGDPATLKWLEEWKKTKGEWPWFVKRSFSTIRKLNGKLEARKSEPPIKHEVLSQDSRKLFDLGKLSVESLNVQCPKCGAAGKSSEIFPYQNIKLEGRCVDCKEIIHNLNTTLLYYCGYIIPDSSVILSGTLSKDLGAGKFFEGFTFLLHPEVRKECDAGRGGRSELKRLADFSSVGRIRLIEIPPKSLSGHECSSSDESIVEGARLFNGIIFTRDGGMYAAVASKGMFCLHGV